MTLRTARLINRMSKVFLASAVVLLILFFAVYMKGGIEFKYVSLPVMACFIGITWLGTSKAAIMALEQEQGKEGSKNEVIRLEDRAGQLRTAKVGFSTDLIFFFGFCVPIFGGTPSGQSSCSLPVY